MSSFTGSVVIYANADPTTSWTYSDTVDLKNRQFLDVEIVASGGSPTSYESKWQSSVDGSTWVDEPTDEVSAGTGLARARIDTLQDDDGTVLSGSLTVHFERRGKRYVRRGIKRTGGDNTARILMRSMSASD